MSNPVLDAILKLNPFDRARYQLAMLEEHGTAEEKEATLIVLLALSAAVDLRKTRSGNMVARRRAQDAFDHWNSVVLDPSKWTESEISI